MSAEAVAWRVKDYADGWILFHHEAPARKSGEARNGALVQALYTPPAPTEAVAWRFKFAAAPSWSYRDEHPAADWADQCRLLQPLYTHPPQPDALPGDMREKVAQCFDARRLVYEDMKNAHDPLDDDTVTAWEKYDFACEAIDHAKDAILSLIQSERGGA